MEVEVKTINTSILRLTYYLIFTKLCAYTKISNDGFKGSSLEKRRSSGTANGCLFNLRVP